MRPVSRAGVYGCFRKVGPPQSAFGTGWRRGPRCAPMVSVDEGLAPEEGERPFRKRDTSSDLGPSWSGVLMTAVPLPGENPVSNEKG